MRSPYPPPTLKMQRHSFMCDYRKKNPSCTYVELADALRAAFGGTVVDLERETGQFLHCPDGVNVRPTKR